MELPSTSPSGRNPASRTSRNSLTERSDVKIAPGLPGWSSARRRMASCGTPAAPRSTGICSVIVSLRYGSGLSAPEPHPGHLPPLRVERENGEAARPGRHRRGGEPRDGGANDRDFRDMVPAVFHRGALPITDPQVKRGNDDPVRAHPGHIGLELDPGVVPGHVDQLDVAAHLGVPCPPPGRAEGPPVVVP